MELVSKDFIQFVDIETTGFDVWRNSIIEFSSVIVDANTLELCDKYTGRSKPESKKYWSEGAEKIHGITYDEAMTFKKPREAAIDYLKFLVPYKHKDNLPMLTVYHGNGNFDPRWLHAFFTKSRLLFSWYKVASLEYTESTIKLSKNHLELENYKLNTVCEKLNIELDHHKSESDTMACYQIYKKLKPLEMKE